MKSTRRQHSYVQCLAGRLYHRPGCLKDNVRGERRRLSPAKLAVTTPHYDPRTQSLVSSPLSDVGEPQRNYVTQVLSEAFAADRLSVEELDDRLALMYQATTTQQLGQLLADPRDPVRSLAQPETASLVAQEFAVPEREAGEEIAPRDRRSDHLAMTCR